jgi:hypothetical protein
MTKEKYEELWDEMDDKGDEDKKGMRLMMISGVMG